MYYQNDILVLIYVYIGIKSGFLCNSLNWYDYFWWLIPNY